MPSNTRVIDALRQQAEGLGVTIQVADGAYVVRRGAELGRGGAAYISGFLSGLRAGASPGPHPLEVVEKKEEREEV